MNLKADGPTVIGGVILGYEDVGTVGLLAAPDVLSGPSLEDRLAGLLDHVHDAVGRVIPRPWVSRQQWQWLHRLVTLSVLGWAFVLAAVSWEVFALTFSHYAGWGWDKGAFFFAWGLGILSCGLYLRPSRKRLANFRLFLGVNLLVLSVLSVVVVTK